MTRRLEIWNWAIKRRGFTVADVRRAFDFSGVVDPTKRASAELRKMLDAGNLTRKEVVTRYGVQYVYRANRKNPPPGRGTSSRCRVGMVAQRLEGRRWRFVRIECMAWAQ